MRGCEVVSGRCNEVGSADVKDNSLNTFDVHSFVGADVVDNTLTGADIQGESLNMTDILDGSLSGAEIANDSLSGLDIGDGSLEAKDIGEGAYTFRGAIPEVPAHQCIEAIVTGVNAQSDHLLLTPEADTTSHQLIYSASFRTVNEEMNIQVCNPRPVPIAESPFARFNLLVIEDGSFG